MYKDYASYLREIFGNRKIQKISINTTRGCPNRDGRIGRGGCIYCNNRSFTPRYCFDFGSITSQINAGKEFFSKKYPDMAYLAYFQSFTNTYGSNIESLENDYREAMNCESIVGVIIGTRPDCIDDDIIQLLRTLNQEVPIFVELGVESLHDETLLRINRGHDSKASIDAIEKLASEGIHVGVHLIAGLPGESEEDIIETIKRICQLPIESIKLHHLQILKDTPLFESYKRNEMALLFTSAQQYADFCMKVINVVPDEICIERFLASAPPKMVEAPKWGIKNYEFTNIIRNKLNSIKQF